MQPTAGTSGHSLPQQHSQASGSRSSSRSPDPEGSQGGDSSAAGAYFNFVNSVVGSGALGIPLALSKAGLAAGILILGLMGVCSDYTLVLLIKSAIITGKSSYQVNSWQWPQPWSVVTAFKV